MSDRAIFEDVNRVIHDILDSTSGVGRESKGVVDSWTSMLGLTKGLRGNVTAWLSSIIQTSDRLSNWRTVLSQSSEGFYKDSIRLRQEFLVSRTEYIELLNARRAGLVVADDELKRRRLAFETSRDTHHAAERLNTSLERAHVKVGLINVLGTALTGLLIDAVNTTDEWNRALSAANIILEKRRQYLNDIVKIQIDTGASTSEMAESTAALVGYGLEARNTFRENLHLVTQLRMGLGVSAEDAAQLAVTSERLKSSFRDLADTLTRIVDSTALSAQEAKNYADQLGRAAMFLTEGARAGLVGPGGSLEFVSRLEGAIKETGGVQGEFARMISDMTSTLEGSMMAPVFGVSPGTLTTSQGTENLMEQLASMVESAQGIRDAGNQQGYLAVLEQIRMLTNDTLSLQTLNSMVRAQRLVAEQRTSDITIEQKWRDELTHTGRLWSRLLNTLKAISVDGLMPLVTIGRHVLTWVVKIVEFIKDIPGAVKVLSGAITVLAAVTIPILIGKFVKLGISLLGVGAAADALAMRQLGSSGIGGVSRGVGGSARRAAATLRMGGLTRVIGGFLGRLPAVIGTFLGPAMLVFAAGAGGVMLGNMLRKYAVDRGTEETKLNIAKIRAEQDVQSLFKARFRAGLRDIINTGGSVDDIQQFLETRQKAALRGNVFGTGLEQAGKLHLLSQEAQAAAEFIAEAKSGRAQISREPSPIEVQAAENDLKQVKILEDTLEVQRQSWSALTNAARERDNAKADAEEKAVRERLQSTHRQIYALPLGY